MVLPSHLIRLDISPSDEDYKTCPSAISGCKGNTNILSSQRNNLFYKARFLSSLLSRLTEHRIKTIKQHLKCQKVAISHKHSISLNCNWKDIVFKNALKFVSLTSKQQLICVL